MQIKRIYLRKAKKTCMVGEAIANFDSFVYVAVGLFVVGLFAVMVYEKTSSRAKQSQHPEDKRGSGQAGK
jgi:hypothetical protein